jgi:hypothetical protein
MAKLLYVQFSHKLNKYAQGGRMQKKHETYVKSHDMNHVQ